MSIHEAATALPDSVPLASVIITEALAHRPARERDPLAESQALVFLMKTLRQPQANVLQDLADTALRLCQAQSAGISIAEIEDGQPVFRWQAAAGEWARFLGDSMPRHASPCGTVLDRNTPLLMRLPERHFPYPLEGVPPLNEVLLVPFEVESRAVGTVWVIAHQEDRQFDREDLRLLTNLSEFASVALQVRQQQQQLFESLQREVAGSHLLQSISGGLISEHDAGALYRQVLEVAQSIMRAQFASLQMLDRDGRLQLIASSGFHPESARFWQVVGLDSRSSCGESLRGRKRFIVSDVDRAGGLLGADDLVEFHRSGIRAVQSTPLISRRGEFLGVISTHWRAPHAPMDSELRIFDVLARQTADLLERANAEAALREVDRRKDEFLAVLGHELRNPLAPLSMGVDLLQRSGQDPALAGSVHAMMRRQVTHLTRLVDDLLDLSRISQGTVELRRGPLDLRVVVEAAVELSRPLVEQRGHRLRVEHADTALQVDGDLERLTQVVANLLGNAAKYMEPGGDILLRSARDGDAAMVRVRDTGFGIPAGQLEDVFEMFTQVPEHRARHGGGGLGIGLALSRRLVDLHGGTLAATSDGPGLGSEFVVRLPVAGALAPAQDELPAALATAPIPRRILVVDDNVDAAESLHRVLALDGHAVEVVHSGPACLAAIDGGVAPEVVLLDIGLPEMDGYAVAQRIRALPGGEDMLLVAITGWGQQNDRDRALAAGFDLHMTKPVSVAMLDEALARRPRTT